MTEIGARCLAVVLLAATTAAAGPARAQPVDPSREAEAPADSIARSRALYIEGVTAFDEERYAEAVRAFRAAYELSRIPAALHSLATALRAQELYADALRATRTLLRDHPDIGPDLREPAEALLAELGDRVGILALRDLPREPAPTLELDGARFPLPATRPVDIDVDPGPHRLRIEAPDRVAFEWTGSVAAGARVELRVELPDATPVAVIPVQPPLNGDDDDDDGEGGSAVPWIVAGVAGTVVIGVVVGVVIATSGSGADRDIEI